MNLSTLLHVACLQRTLQGSLSTESDVTPCAYVAEMRYRQWQKSLSRTIPGFEAIALSLTVPDRGRQELKWCFSHVPLFHETSILLGEGIKSRYF